MYHINFSKPISVHFIGIGGISMSGLAEILLDRGFHISGSDSKKSDLTIILENKGINVFYGQSATNITQDIDLVVYTAAIHPENPELIEALANKIPCITRAELLGQIMQNYETPIAISGTHGKTTTTSMVSEILLKAGVNPTLSIGGILKSLGSNIRVGSSPYFVTEACEYTNSFLNFFPKISLILNVEADHMDFFKNIEEIRQSFHKFASLIPEDGILIINGEISHIEEITSGLKCRIITYGFNENFDYYPTNISYDELARPTYTLNTKGKDTQGIVTLGVNGEHNIYNSMGAIALCDLIGINRETVLNALFSFTGTERRFEFKGKLGDITIIDDYAHHPTEIKATLTTAVKYPHNSIWCVFQPHTYTRTKAFFHEFAEALSLADHVILTDIYAAREKNTIGISSKDLLTEIKKQNIDCHYFETFDEIENYLLLNCESDDLLITMGAGDVVKIGEKLLGK